MLPGPSHAPAVLLMIEPQVAALVAELDALVPRSGAVLRSLYGDRDPCWTGNRLGYLRLGIELLKVADAPPDPRQPDRVLADLSYFFRDDPDIRPGELAIFARHEDRPPWRDESAASTPRFRGFLGIIIAGVLGVALVLGVDDVVRALRELVRW